MIPISLAVRLLQYWGVIGYIAHGFSPLFHFLGLPGSAAIAFIKAQAATPTITAADGQRIVLANGQSDSRILFDINAESILTWNGTNWEV